MPSPLLSEPFVDDRAFSNARAGHCNSLQMTSSEVAHMQYGWNAALAYRQPQIGKEALNFAREAGLTKIKIKV